MSVLLLTILGSLLLAAFFVAAFSFDRLSRGGASRWQRDSLLPLEEPDKKLSDEPNQEPTDQVNHDH